eukprot:5275403-Heterocapsa_arctica.AAC.1
MLRCTGEQPSPDTLQCRFHRNIEHLPELLRDMQDYDRMRDDEPDRSYEWLRFACNRALEKWRATGHRRDYAATLRPGKGVPGAPAAQTGPGGKELCRMFAWSGSC